MSWHQISSNFANLNSLQLIQLRCDPGISLSDKNRPTTINNCPEGVVFVPKQEPQDLTATTNLLYRPCDTLPNFEEHDIGGYNFKLSIRQSQCANNTQWLYSEPLNKLFIRLNKVLNVDITYKPRILGEQLRVRAFICFLKEVSEPVRRCANHLSKDLDTTSRQIEREHVLRCENPSAIYCGSAEGKNIRDRYSVVIPLNMDSRTPDDAVRQTLAFKFTCQNSCIGRKQTCLMILLEDSNGVILAQRWLYLRICSCPKRDKSFEERHALLRCVTGGSDSDDPHNRPKPTNSNCNSETSALTTNGTKQYDLQATPSGGVRLVFEVSSKEIAMGSIQFALGKECVNIVNQSRDAKRSARCVRRLKRLYDDAQKM